MVNPHEASSVQVARNALLWLTSWTNFGSLHVDDPLLESHPADRLGDHPEDYALFRMKDMNAWIIFTAVFVVLVVFDNAVLHRRQEKISFGLAMVFTVFWICCALAFCGYIYSQRGLEDAFDWGTGYLLEWMLSVDNLFVFHRVFAVFGTPDEQKHKPLFWGIAGAIVFRMLFFIIEEFLMHSIWWMHIVFGLFLVYTGVKSVTIDEDEDGPENNPVFMRLQKMIPFVNRYDAGGRFFVRVPVDVKTGEVVTKAASRRQYTARGEKKGGRQISGGSDGACGDEETRAWSGECTCLCDDTQGKIMTMYTDDGDTPPVKVEVIYRTRATLLMLVVVCLEVTDVIFAVDSVSAIVAQIPDLYLAYTACVFAMLGLRAMFFVIDELVKLFSLLSYGVAAILVFIGVKLIFKSWIHIPPFVVCGILVTTLAVSMIGSVVYEKYRPEEESDAGETPRISP